MNFKSWKNSGLKWLDMNPMMSTEIPPGLNIHSPWRIAKALAGLASLGLEESDPQHLQTIKAISGVPKEGTGGFLWEPL